MCQRLLFFEDKQSARVWAYGSATHWNDQHDAAALRIVIREGIGAETDKGISAMTINDQPRGVVTVTALAINISPNASAAETTHSKRCAALNVARCSRKKQK